MATEGPFVREATPEDADDIRALLGECFPDNPKASGDVFAWQYWANPFGPPCSWVAESDGRIVAHYAGIQYPGVVGVSPTPLALGVDAATHPQFRGLGLFEQLARAVYLGNGRAGAPLTYCLPNPNSLRGFQKAGGQTLGRARVLVAPLDPAWLGQRFHLPGAAAKLVVRSFRIGAGREADATGAPPGDLDELWTRVAADHGDGVARSAPWWTWRYPQRPGPSAYLYFESRRANRLTGAAVGLCREDLGGRFLCLLEFLAEDTAAARALIGKLGEAAGPLGAVGLAATALEGTALYRRLRQGGLRPLPRRFEPVPLHVGLVDNLGTAADLSRRQWSLAWGDLDHI